MQYEVRFTRLAQAVLGDRRAAFEERLRGELAHDLPADSFPPVSIIFHSLQYDGRLLIASGKKDHILVDTATVEDGPVLDTGPFAGSRMSMPVPDSE